MDYLTFFTDDLSAKISFSMENGLSSVEVVTTPPKRRGRLNDEHCVAVAVEPIFFADCFVISPPHQFIAAECADQDEQGGARQMEEAMKRGHL